MKMSEFPLQLKLPLTGSPLTARFSEKAASTEGLSIGWSKVTTIGAVREAPEEPSVGMVEVIEGLVGTRGAGLTATPTGPSPVGTVGVLFGESAPPVPTSNWERLSLAQLAT